MKAGNAENATWYAGGILGDSFRSYGGKRFNPPRTIPWLRIDPKTGELSGTPRLAGVYPVIVSCVREAEGSSRRDLRATIDAALLVLRVSQ